MDFGLPANRVYMIAEIGINHNGSLDIARQLITNSKKAGFDAVKFQKRTIDIVYSSEFLAQPRESPWGNTQRHQKEGLEFSIDQYFEIDTFCRDIGIDWFASSWDIPSQESMRIFNFPYNKVASAMATNHEFLKVVSSERKPTFLSTGMCDYADIDSAVDIFREQGCPLMLFHTVSEYPALEEALNLLCLSSLKERYNLPVGYSGHEAGVSPSVFAAMLGATSIERHVTLDRAMYGSDQSASLEFNGMCSLVNMIRKIPICLGSGEKSITPTEERVAEKLRYWNHK
jgi:N-acetylneuraminate synthase